MGPAQSRATGRKDAGSALGERAARAGLTVGAEAPAHGLHAGRWGTLRRGASTEFYDYRASSAGDPARLLDWRVYARTDRFYVRRHRHEAQRTIVLALDASASMGFAGLADEARKAPPAARGPSKLARARELAGALAYLAVRQADRVALVWADADGVKTVGAGAGPGHLRAILGALAGVRAGGEDGPVRALEAAGAIARRERAALVALTDALDEPAALLAALAGPGRGSLLLQVLTDDELDLSALASATLADPEGGARVPAFEGETALGYAEALGEHLSALDAGLARLGARRSQARTSEDPLDSLRRALAPAGSDPSRRL